MYFFTSIGLSKSQNVYKLFCCRNFISLACVNYQNCPSNYVTNRQQNSAKHIQRQCALNCPFLKRNMNFNYQIQRFKSGKRRSNSKSTGKEDDDTSDDDDDEDDDEESFSDIEPDFDAPLVYKHTFVHSLRADHIIAKGLSISKSEADRLFYSSKFLHRGKTLLKKAQKVGIGDHVDVVHGNEDGKLLVQRVKVIKILNRVTRKGNPVVAVRVWKKPFEIIHKES